MDIPKKSRARPRLRQSVVGRLDARMRPLRYEHTRPIVDPFTPSVVERQKERVFRYASSNGREFESHVIPEKRTDIIDIQVYERLRGKMVEVGSCRMSPTEGAIHLFGGGKEGSVGNQKPDWSTMGSLRYIDMFRPIVDAAMRYARQHDIHRITLETTSARLRDHYARFGFQTHHTHFQSRGKRYYYMSLVFP